jgi:hypothetical protein
MKGQSRSIIVVFLVVIAAAILPAAALGAEFHSEVSHTTYSGTQIGETVLTVNAGTLTCAEVTTSSTATAATSTTLNSGTATFNECRAFGFVSATADLNGCEFEASADTNQVNIVNCVSPAVFTAFNCWVTLGNQSGLGSTTYTNAGTGTGRYLIGHANLSGVKYTQDSKSFPGCTNGTFENGTLVGEGTLKGANTLGEQVGIWKE